MRLLGILFLLLSLGLISASCTKRDPQTKKEAPKPATATEENNDLGNDEDESIYSGGGEEEESAPDYSGKKGTQGSSDTEPNSSTIPSTEYVRLLNGWSGTDDINPPGLKFYTRSFEQAPGTTGASPNPAPGSAGTGTFTALVAEFRAQGCLTCHTQGGREGGRPLDNHTRMMNGQTPQAWVTGAAASVRSGRMPQNNRTPQGQWAINANKIDQLLQAWRSANYPAQ